MIFCRMSSHKQVEKFGSGHFIQDDSSLSVCKGPNEWKYVTYPKTNTDKFASTPTPVFTPLCVTQLMELLPGLVFISIALKEFIRDVRNKPNARTDTSEVDIISRVTKHKVRCDKIKRE